MITKQTAIFVGIGVLIIAAILSVTLYSTRGSHLTLEGKVLKVRTLATDEKNSIAVIDFRVTNRSDLLFVTQGADVTVKGPDGKEITGDTIARTDIDRVMDYYKVLGPKYNQTLIMRDKLAPGESMDRMVAATFPIPEAELEKRAKLTVRLHDVDGATFDLSESR